MQGYLLNFSIQTNMGYISGDDGQRYEFNGEEWKENFIPQRGLYVDFKIDPDGKASAVFTSITNKNGKNTNFNRNPVNIMNRIPSGIQHEPLYDQERNYTIIDWFTKCLRNYINFDGRARRAEFWSFQLCYWGIFVLGVCILGVLFAFFLDQPLEEAADGIMFFIVMLYLLLFIWGVFTILMFIPMLSVAVRRLHDVNLSGFWLLLHFIPVGSIAVWIMFCINTKFEENQWGPPAKSQ